MELKKEIMKKYILFQRSKKLTILSATLMVISLFGYLTLKSLNINLVSIALLSLFIISFVIFFIFWMAIRPMKKHILSLIKEYEN